MLSRRILRIKALQVLYASFQSNESSLSKVENDLQFSLKKSYDLYHYLLLLILDLAHFSRRKIEIGLEKNLPTPEERNPNTRFVDNRLILQIETNQQLLQYLNENRLSWANNPELIRALYDKMIQSDLYSNYMNAGESNYETDRKFLLDLYSFIIPESEELSEILEEQSIFWNDELEFVLSMIITTLQRFKQALGEKVKLLPMVKNEDDIDFVKTLVRKTIVDQAINMDRIKLYARNWEIDRIAFMDILIMMMALTEAIHFPAIPVKVSMNEYLEIAKYYSTDKSSNFINGILDHAISDLKTQKLIQKSGTGLIGEI